MLKQNQIIKDGKGKTRKVLGVCGDVVFISGSTWEHAGYTETEKDLKECGFTWEEDKWEPKAGEKFFYIGSTARIGGGIWDGLSVDEAVQSFLGVYKDQSSAEEALKEIKRKLNIA